MKTFVITVPEIYVMQFSIEAKDAEEAVQLVNDMIAVKQFPIEYRFTFVSAAWEVKEQTQTQLGTKWTGTQSAEKKKSKPGNT